MSAVSRRKVERRMDKKSPQLELRKVQSGGTEGGQADRGAEAAPDVRAGAERSDSSREPNRKGPNANEGKDARGGAGVHNLLLFADGGLADSGDGGSGGNGDPPSEDRGKRKGKGASPTQRTLEWLRKQGYQVASVEKWKPVARFNNQTGKKELSSHSESESMFSSSGTSSVASPDGESDWSKRVQEPITRDVN